MIAGYAIPTAFCHALHPRGHFGRARRIGVAARAGQSPGFAHHPPNATYAIPTPSAANGSRKPSAVPLPSERPPVT